MNNRKQGLRVLGVSLLAALGLMAFGASAASASGSFLITGLATPWSNVPITGAGENLLEGRFWILGLNVEISCHAATATGNISSNGHSDAELIFSNCLASGTNADGTLKGAICKLTNNIVAKVLGLVILHNSKPYVLFSPLKEFFAEVNGAPCLPSAKVTGSAVVSISNPDADNVEKLISSKGMLTLFTNDKLFYGINEAHLDADANVVLGGSHIGLTWGAV